MKMTYDEFNELQRLQAIRDYAQETWNDLYLLKQYTYGKYKKQLWEAMMLVKDMENEAVEGIGKMIEGDEDE